MPEPIYTAFYTRDTIYEQEAARLRASLDSLGLPHDIRAVDDRGNWMRNAAQTAEHVFAMLAAYPDRPVVQLDADAVIWKRPELFYSMPDGVDVALHYRRGVELLNGTVWFAPTDGARLVAEKYRDLVLSQPGCTNEQTLLAAAINELSDVVKVHRLPASYCWIHDIMKDDMEPGESAVIEHLQASRVSHNSPLLPSREKRLRELEGYVFPAA